MSEVTPERREEKRLRCLLTGRIVLDAHTSTMDCTVRSMSEHGARIVASDPFRVPREFDLAIPHHDEMHHAEVVWRKGDSIGLTLSGLAERAAARHRMTPRQQRRARLKALANSCYA